MFQKDLKKVLKFWDKMLNNYKKKTTPKNQFVSSQNSYYFCDVIRNLGVVIRSICKSIY